MTQGDGRRSHFRRTRLSFGWREPLLSRRSDSSTATQPPRWPFTDVAPRGLGAAPPDAPSSRAHALFRPHRLDRFHPQHSGEALRLERSGDLGDGNAGLLIFVDGAEHPEYVPWADVEQVDFDRPLEMFPSLARR